MAKYDSRRYGESSREKADTQALRDAWDTADRMNAELPEGTGWRWVPKGTVFIDESILPRDGGVDPKLVQQYADVWHDLPPITVQRASFKLIDGAHRLNAAFETQAGTDHVKVVEEDLADADLRERAYDLNVRHGRALTLKERTAFARLLIERHPNSPTTEISTRTGMDRGTISRLRDRVDPVKSRVVMRSDGKPYTAPDSAPQSAGFPHTDPQIESGNPTPQPQKTPVTHSPVRDAGYPPETEPMALTGLRAIASIRNVSQWMETNAQFGDEIREHLQPARKILAEMADVLEAVAI